MKKQHIYRAILIIAALVIWGNNIIQFFSGIRDQEELDRISFKKEDHLESMVQDTVERDIAFQYQAKYRDPFKADFLLISEPSSKPVVVPKKQSVKKKIPLYYYRGLIRSHTGQLAILENTNGEIVFTRISENVEGIVIQKITEDSLQCQYENKKFWLKLNE